LLHVLHHKQEAMYPKIMCVTTPRSYTTFHLFMPPSVVVFGCVCFFC
jgi:hypothetical protein